MQINSELISDYEFNERIIPEMNRIKKENEDKKYLLSSFEEVYSSMGSKIERYFLHTKSF